MYNTYYEINLNSISSLIFSYASIIYVCIILHWFAMYTTCWIESADRSGMIPTQPQRFNKPSVSWYWLMMNGGQQPMIRLECGWHKLLSALPAEMIKPGPFSQQPFVSPYTSLEAPRVEGSGNPFAFPGPSWGPLAIWGTRRLPKKTHRPSAEAADLRTHFWKTSWPCPAAPRPK